MVNKVILVGNLGSDPEFIDQHSICKFSLATTERWRSKEGVKKEETQWHNCVVFGKLAEFANSYLKKGSKIYLEGQIKYNSFEKDGVTKYSTSINTKEIKILDSKSEKTNHGVPEKTQSSNKDEDTDDLPF